MEPNTIVVEAEEVSTPSRPQRISLEQTQKAAPIKAPTFWRNAKAFASKHVVKPLKERTADGRAKARVVATNLHAVPSRTVAEKSYHMAERVAGEVSGAVSAVTKIVTTGATAFAAGLLTGTRGVSPTALKRMRLAADAESLMRVGTWKVVDRIRNAEGDIEEHLVMDLSVDIRTGGPVPGNVEFTAPLQSATEDSIKIGGRDTDVLAFPYRHDNGALIGLLVAVNSETDRSMYLWIDQPE